MSRSNRSPAEHSRTQGRRSAATTAIVAALVASILTLDGAAYADPVTPRSPARVIVLDRSERNAAWDISKVKLAVVRSKRHAAIVTRISAYADSYHFAFPEVTTITVWFNTDRDDSPEFLMREGSRALFRMKNWSSEPKRMGKDSCRLRANSVNDVMVFKWAPGCFGVKVRRVSVHVRSDYTGDGERCCWDHAPNVARTWSKRLALVNETPSSASE